MKKQRGFTLPELLITIGIVGIVAALLVPSLVKLRPDYNKVMYLKAYDALTTMTDAIARDQDIYHTKYFDGTTGKQYDVKRYPLLDLSTGDKYQYSGASKLGNVLKEVLGGVGNSPADFNTKNGINWNISDSSVDFGASTVKFRNEVVIDVNGNKGPNAFYTPANGISNPDRFKFYITSNGIVQPADKYGQMYLATRGDWLNRGDNGDKVQNGPYNDLTGTDMTNIQTDYDNGWGVETREVIYDDDGNPPVNSCSSLSGAAYDTCMCTTMGYLSHCPVCYGKSGNDYETCMCSKGYTSHCPQDSCDGKVGVELAKCNCEKKQGLTANTKEWKECLCNSGVKQYCENDPCAGKAGEDKAKCECSQTYTANTSAWNDCMCGKNYSGYCPACYGKTGQAYEDCMCEQDPNSSYCDACKNYTQNTTAWYKCMCDNGPDAGNSTYCCSGYQTAAFCCTSSDCSCNCEYNNLGNSSAIESCKCNNCGIGCGTPNPCAGKKGLEKAKCECSQYYVTNSSSWEECLCDDGYSSYCDPCEGLTGTELCKCENDESDWCTECNVGCSTPDPCKGKTGKAKAICQCEGSGDVNSCVCNKGYSTDACPCLGKTGTDYEECMCEHGNDDYCDPCDGLSGTDLCKCENFEWDWCDECGVGCGPCHGLTGTAKCKCEKCNNEDTDDCFCEKCNSGCPVDPCAGKTGTELCKCQNDSSDWCSECGVGCPPCYGKSGKPLDECECEQEGGDFNECMCGRGYNSYCKDPCEEKCGNDDDCYCKCNKCGDSNKDDCFCAQCDIGCDPCASINKNTKPKAWACCQYENYGTYGCECKQDADHCCGSNDCECKCGYANDKDACLCSQCGIGCSVCAGLSGKEKSCCEANESGYASEGPSNKEYNCCVNDITDSRVCDCEHGDSAACCALNNDAASCCKGTPSSNTYKECVCDYTYPAGKDRALCYCQIHSPSNVDQCMCKDGYDEYCPEKCLGYTGYQLDYCKCEEIVGSDSGDDFDKCMCNRGQDEFCVHSKCENLTGQAKDECECDGNKGCMCQRGYVNSSCPCNDKSGKALAFCECRLTKDEDTCNCEVYNKNCNNNQSQGSSGSGSNGGVNPVGSGGGRRCEEGQSAEDCISTGGGGTTWLDKWHQ